jgi:alkylresorcinol/alkylpyrone synthase
MTFTAEPIEGTEKLSRTMAPGIAQDIQPASRAGLDVEILSIATATPEFQTTRSQATERAKALWPHHELLWRRYDNTGIDTRYSCEPHDWYMQSHNWEERTYSFQKHAVNLLEQVTIAAVRAAGIEIKSIDMVVTNTVTGLAIPSLDAKLFNRLQFSNTVERLPIFGLGCGGGVAGLARATRLARSMPGANVLFLTVDLCTLCLRINDPSPAMFVSGALFGDGAAGAVLRAANGSAQEKSSLPRIRAVGEWCWRNTEHIMGWDIKEDGFGVVLSAQLPALMEKELKPALQDFLDRNGLHLEEFKGLLFHPGGRKLLEVVEKTLGIERNLLSHSWNVLRQYGNMSSATALFVLERALLAGDSGRHLMAAFGPGFSAYFVAADL